MNLKRMGSALLMALVLLVPIVASAPAMADGGWTIQTVDSTVNLGLGYFPSLALDSSGNPHISYWDTTNYDLKYASWNGTAWSIQTVDGAGNVGFDSSLALDSSGNPRISYYDYDNDALKYASWSGTAWKIETVDSTGDVGSNSSLALDSFGNPHISYYEYTNDDLKYASWSGTAWSIQTVHSAGEISHGSSSLALDSSGNPHISYKNWTDDDKEYLKYASWNGTAWDIETVERTGELSGGLSLALDSSGNPHISYDDGTNNYLKYASWSGTSWKIETVDSGGDVGYGPSSLALDSSGNPHISYSVANNHNLNYASWNGTAWSIQTVDSAGDVGSDSSLALDSSSKPHISYSDVTNDALKYAYSSKPLPPSSQWRSTFYFAEGYTGTNFQEYACLENPNASVADTWITCMFNDGTTMSKYYSLAPSSRLTVDINQLAGAGKELSLRIVSTSAGIVAERPMYFNYNGTWTGGSDAIGATSPSSNWYFAEGNTLSNFDQYVTVLNPGGTTAKLTFHYMVEGQGEKVTTGSVPAHSRATFKTRDQIGNNLNASLYLESSQSVVAERPMYFDYNTWTGGHDVVGANSPASAWYFAEGTTRSNFNEWLCLQNPGKSKITVKARYQLGSGQGTPISKTYTVPAKQRLTVLVNSEIGANKDNSVQLTSEDNFIAERPMYFNYYGNWTGGHDVLGANSPATSWSFAEGTTRDNFNEWLCLQNPGSNDTHVVITYYTTSGQAIRKGRTVKANSRLTVNVNESAGANLDISAKVTSDRPIIVERPMYFNYNGWTGGHDVVGLTQ
jgi:hypothetical protein